MSDKITPLPTPLNRLGKPVTEPVDIYPSPIVPADDAPFQRPDFGITDAVDVYPTHYGLTDRLAEEIVVALRAAHDAYSDDYLRQIIRPIVGRWVSEWRAQND